MVTMIIQQTGSAPSWLDSEENQWTRVPCPVRDSDNNPWTRSDPEVGTGDSGRADNDDDDGGASTASTVSGNKGKGKAVAETPVIDVTLPFEGWQDPEDEMKAEPKRKSSVDWAQHEPPAALLTIPEGASELIADLVKTSIDNVRAQIVAEETARREREAEAERLREEEEDRRALNAPEVFVEMSPAPSVTSTRESADGEEGSADHASQHVSEKRKIRRGLARLLRHVRDGSDKAESSAAAAKRLQRFSASGADLVLMAAVTPAAMFASMNDKGKRKGKAREMEKEVEQVEPQPKEPEPVEMVECISCYDDIPADTAVRATCHPYCKPCFARLVTTATENEAQWPPKCCLNELPTKLILKHIPRDLAKTYTARAAEFRIPVDERLYCPTVDCGVFVPKSGVSLLTRVAKCSAGHATCTTCRQPAHGRGTACPRDEAELQATEALANDEGWRRCPRCSILIEHREACQHMTCRCGSEFCYVCGAAWRTCSCGMDQLNQLKAAAAQRRAEREARESEEARELREALRQIEEFEREEARKAELLAAEAERHRRETVRLERWRRRLERAERRRVEQARREAVQGKYKVWGEELEVLRTTQLRELEKAHDDEPLAFNVQSVAETVAMHDRHARDLASSRAETAERIRAHDALWARDFAARVAVELQLEEAYGAQLGLLWAKRKDGPARREAALRAYQRRNDARMDEYARWREGELAAFQFEVKEEQAIREELMARESALYEDLTRKRREAMERRLAAERTWFDIVFAERVRLLGEMEDVERDGGDVDIDLEGDESSDEEDEEVFEDAPEEAGPSDWPLRQERLRHAAG